MKASIFTTIRFVFAAFTVVAILVHPHIPSKARQLFPHAGTESNIYGPPDRDDTKFISWVNEANNTWRCDYKRVFGPDNCGVAMTWKTPAAENCSRLPETPASNPVDEPLRPVALKETANGRKLAERACAHAGAADLALDFSDFDGLRVKINYEGRARFLRLYMRNHNPEYTGADRSTDDKFMRAIIRTDDLKAGHIYVDLDEFAVEEGWVKSVNASRQQALPEFQHVTTLGVDLIEHGIHKVRVDRIELVGKRFTIEALLVWLLAVWSGVLLLEAAIRYYGLYRASVCRVAQIRHPAADRLECEKRILKTHAVTDALTGAYNRSGVERQLLAWQADSSLPLTCGLLMFDIDHFKGINDTHGYKACDRILKELTQCIEDQIRQHDIFARWGGAEFILITRQTGKNGLIRFAEKLRVLVEKQLFDPALRQNITVSVGITAVQPGDSFNLGLKRADSALNSAKMQRNCVVYVD